MFLCYDFGKKPVIMYDLKKEKEKKASSTLHQLVQGIQVC